MKIRETLGELFDRTIGSPVSFAWLPCRCSVCGRAYWLEAHFRIWGSFTETSGVSLSGEFLLCREHGAESAEEAREVLEAWSKANWRAWDAKFWRGLEEAKR